MPRSSLRVVRVPPYEKVEVTIRKQKARTSERSVSSDTVIARKVYGQITQILPIKREKIRINYGKLERNLCA